MKFSFQYAIANQERGSKSARSTVQKVQRMFTSNWIILCKNVNFLV